MQFETFIFDCDGVILDSNHMKIDAMKATLQEYDNVLVAQFVRCFKENFGRSRNDHFQIFFNEHLKRTPMKGELESLMGTYGALCKKLYLDVPLCIGALNLINKLGSSKCWVVSASDQNELVEIFSLRNMTSKFSAIYGGPESKSQNLRKVLSTYRLKPDRTCFIGDSYRDYEAASIVDIHFIFCKQYSNTPELAKDFQESGIPVIQNLATLL